MAFELGRVVTTPGALETLDIESIQVGLARHAQHDWGEVCQEDKHLNDQALEDGTRLLSAYTDATGTKFWIITEADRSVTTILLPEEY